MDRRPALRRRAVPDDPLPVRPVPAVPRGGAYGARPRHRRHARRTDALPVVHDRARRVDRHRQRRRRRHGDHLGRAGGAVLDLVLRPGGDGHQDDRGDARPAVPRDHRARPLDRADVLPARRPALADAGLDLRARCRRGGAHHDAVHPAQLDRRRPAGAGRRADHRLGDRAGGADLAGDHRRPEVDRERRRAALAAQGRALPGRRPDRDRDLRRAAARGAGAGRDRGLLDAGGGRRLGRRGDAGGAPLRPGPGHLRQRGRLRHRRRRLRDGGQPRARPAGHARHRRGLHRVVRHLDDQRPGAAADRRVAGDGARRGRRGRRLRGRDAGRRRLAGRLLRLPLRLHHADRLGLLRRAVPRVPARPPRQRALSLDLLPADPVRRRLQGRRRVGVGRPDERAPGIPQHDRAARPQRAGGVDAGGT